MNTRYGTIKSRTFQVALGVLPLLALLSIQPAWAKKPPRPQPPPPAEGTIYCYAYYNIYGDGYTTYSMAADGSDTVAVIQGLQQDSHPSQGLHGGERWFLGLFPVEGEFYPDQRQRYEFYAVSESGTIVQLSDDPTVQPRDYSDPGPNEQDRLWAPYPRWTMEDRGVSFMGQRWGVDPVTGEPVIVEEGMFLIGLADDIATQPPPAQPVYLPIEFQFQEYVASYEWSPDSTKIAYYVAGFDGGIYVVNVDTGVSQQIVAPTTPDSLVGSPTWTPDGSTIVFVEADLSTYLEAIRKVSVDGTGLTTLAISDERKGDLGRPVVSPDGGFVAFDRFFWGTRHGKPGGPSLLPKSAIYLMDINGANEVKIKDMDNHLECTGWRE